MKNKNVGSKIIIGIPTYDDGHNVGGVSVEWAIALAQLQTPLGTSVAKKIVKGRPIDEARNEIVEYALSQEAQWVFFLGDDVLPNPDSIMRMLRREKDIVTGVYWTKEYPTWPYLWRGNLIGPYMDWKIGEFFEIDYAGCDCLLVNTKVFKKMTPPYFSLEWIWQKGAKPEALNTEDFYFYAHVKKLGFTVWCDTTAMCLHQDRKTGVKYGLTTEMPQYTGKQYSESDNTLIAILGSGAVQHPKGGKHIRYDIREEVNPDVRCDIRSIPEPDEKFDMIVASHVLEHLDALDVEDALAEWVRILKVGGKIEIAVPNIEVAFKNILNGTDESYDWAMIWGQSGIPEMVHKNGFNPRVLKKLLQLNGCLKDIKINNSNPSSVLAVAIKYKHKKIAVLQELFENQFVEEKLERRKKLLKRYELEKKCDRKKQ